MMMVNESINFARGKHFAVDRVTNARFATLRILEKSARILGSRNRTSVGAHLRMPVGCPRRLFGNSRNRVSISLYSSPVIYKDQLTGDRV